MAVPEQNVSAIEAAYRPPAADVAAPPISMSPLLGGRIAGALIVLQHVAALAFRIVLGTLSQLNTVVVSLLILDCTIGFSLARGREHFRKWAAWRIAAGLFFAVYVIYNKGVHVAGIGHFTEFTALWFLLREKESLTRVVVLTVMSVAGYLANIGLFSW